MKYILDVNIILASLIRDSFIRKLIAESGLELYFPSVAYDKVMKYRAYVMEKASIDEREFYLLLSKILAHVNLLSDETTKPYLDKAWEAMGRVDAEDVIFVAAALAVGDAAIWSDDKHMKKQKIIPVVTTKDMSSAL